jgi:REP element-mobilizing transposase RayT
VARRLRIQYPGAIYHVINRGNYRADVFGSVGAAQAFEAVLDEGCGMFGWVIHAYVIMRNHFHLALETPEPNLVDGMHWLQSTYATRFNRFRGESGHLFQGRYQSLLIEDSASLVRVVDYIHLNPVRAQIVTAEQAASFRWSSLARFRRSETPQWLVSSRWLDQLGLSKDAEGWRQYLDRLLSVSASSDAAREGNELCRGWAIGTSGWRRAVAKDHQHLALQPGIALHEIRELKHARWSEALAGALERHGRTPETLREGRKGEHWKRAVAGDLRKQVGASHAWLAENLHMGSPNSVRAWLSRPKQTSMHISA